MMNRKLSSVLCLISLVCFPFVFFSSCEKSTYNDENDTIRGMWGCVQLYNEYGIKETNHSDVSILVRCVDTITNESTIWDTSFYVTTNSQGDWEVRNAHEGWYSFDFSKQDYCKNRIYAHYYDTSSADTLENMYLAKPTQGNVAIDSISYKDGVLSLYRTVFFTAQYSSYGLATWYFFGKDADVSPENYVYAYVSGSVTGTGNSKQSGVTYKSMDKLLEAGFVEGETVYVRSYCDNARAISYQIDEDTYVYPNILDGSNVMSFDLPETTEE